MDMLHSIKQPQYTCEKINEILKLGHHTTVMHGIKKIKQYAEIYPDFRIRYKQVHIYVFGSLEYFFH